MSKLRQQFIQALSIRGYSSTTQNTYVGYVAKLAGHYRRAPDQLSVQQIQDYLYYLLNERHYAQSSLGGVVGALRFFYRHVLGWPEDRIGRDLPRSKQPKRLPEVYSQEEIEQLFSIAYPNPRQRVFLMTVYGAGLRVSEGCHLQLRHLESQRGLIRVEQGKRAKDRYTLLSDRLLQELRAYWRMYRPPLWLFPSARDIDRPLAAHPRAEVLLRGRAASRLAAQRRDPCPAPLLGHALVREWHRIDHRPAVAGSRAPGTYRRVPARAPGASASNPQSAGSVADQKPTAVLALTGRYVSVLPV